MFVLVLVSHFVFVFVVVVLACLVGRAVAATPATPARVQCATIVHDTCPTCRTPFVTHFNVPDPRADPTRWFHIVDYDQVHTS